MIDLLAQAGPKLGFWGLQPNSPQAWTAIFVALLVSGAMAFGLMYIPTRARRPVVMTLTFAAGLIYVVWWIWPTPISRQPGDIPRDAKENIGFWIGDAISKVADISNILTTILLGLGIYSLMRIHLGKIFKRQADRGFSVVLIVSMLAITLFGYADWVTREFGDKQGKLNDMANWMPVNFGRDLLFDGFLMQMDSAMFSMIAFFILSAAYRAFRIRSVESTVLMASALILMISLLGGVVYGWNHGVSNIAASMNLPHADPSVNEASYLNSFKLTSVAGWVRGFLQVPALRAVDFGIGLGALAMGLRLWLGLEKGGVTV
jgi:hypothetical protein